MEPEGATHNLVPAEPSPERRYLQVRPPQQEPPRQVEPDDDLVVELEKSDATTPLLICTGVPLPAVSRSIQTQTECDSDDREADDEEVQLSYSSMDDTSPACKRFQFWSFACGLLVGGFIQLSSLGANYVLSELYDNNEGTEGGELSADGDFVQETLATSAITATDLSEANDSVGASMIIANRAHIITFSLLWSIVTSLMGVSVLLLVRGLLIMYFQDTPLPTAAAGFFELRERLTSWITRLECSFAVGTLLGLCIVCILTDILLGCAAHLGHSMLTLVVALLWCKLLLYCAGAANAGSDDDDEVVEDLHGHASCHVTNEMQDHDEQQLLMLKPSETCELHPHGRDSASHQPQHKTSVAFRLTCIVLGLLIGFFTQLSSLGANFMLSHWQVPRTSNAVFWVSLAWSLITSLMGIFIMVMVRCLVVTLATRMSWSFSLCTCSLHDVILQLECSFAIGALLGVNVAWMVTDLILGMQLHLCHSIVSLTMALLWCQTVIWCVRCRRLKQQQQQQAHQQEHAALLLAEQEEERREATYGHVQVKIV